MKISQTTVAAGLSAGADKRREDGEILRVRMPKGWTLYDPRLAWLIAPVLLLLIIFLVLPIVLMAVYTFFTFVTCARVEA
ncbi:MAG: hypothetical protein EOS28_32340 [Mesorhizobium sp.]|nr:MAG: hypothetical protein EOS28_32340 [Mesorhizobium sp.]